jgi:hypothetical protein
MPDITWALAEIYPADDMARAISDGLAFQAFSASVAVRHFGPISASRTSHALIWSSRTPNKVLPRRDAAIDIHKQTVTRK